MYQPEGSLGDFLYRRAFAGPDGIADIFWQSPCLDVMPNFPDGVKLGKHISGAGRPQNSLAKRNRFSTVC